MDEIIHNLFLGDRDDAVFLTNLEIDNWVIIAVTEYESEIPNEPHWAIRAPFMRGDMADLSILNDIAKTIHNYLDDGKKILVHCVHAHERSPLAIAWFLVKDGKCPDLNAAYDLIIQKHPTAVRRLYWLPLNARPYPYDGTVGKAL